MTPQQLQALIQPVMRLPLARAQEAAPYITAAMQEAGITTPQRVAAFIAQVAHESGAFLYKEEIASGANYEGRRDLGNTQPGDGVRFKGRGYIQITGRSNYTDASRDLGIDIVSNPAIAAQPAVAARVAAWYWRTRKLNELADRDTQEAFDQITRKINGGLLGKAQRDALWNNAKAVLRGAGPSGASTMTAGESSSGGGGLLVVAALTILGGWFWFRRKK